MSPLERSKKILELTLSNGGLSYDVNTDTIPKNGYILSPYKSNERIIPVKELTVYHILLYLTHNHNLLTKKNHYFGSWVSGNNCYLDVSIIVDSLRLALELARSNDQKAVFDLSTFNDIPVK